jgi:hypothetical protein
MFADLLPFVTQAGVVGVLAWVAYRLHLDAVRAERGRADDWRAAAQREAARADERDRQLAHILDAVRAQTTPAGTG